MKSDISLPNQSVLSSRSVSGSNRRLTNLAA